MLASVSDGLWPARPNWQDPVDVLDDGLRTVILDWAWTHAEMQHAVLQGFRVEADQAEVAKPRFFEIVRRWMLGESFVEIGQQLQINMDDLPALHTRAITYTLQTLVEQGLSLLARRLQADDLELAVGVSAFTQQLRFGAPNVAARLLAEMGVRHRRAYVALGNAITQPVPLPDFTSIKANAREGLRQDEAGWRAYLGDLVYSNTLKDLT